MNKGHAALCSSPRWAKHIATVVLPEALDLAKLTGPVLEIGPGYGASTAEFVRAGLDLTVVETDEVLAAGIEERFVGVTVVRGSGAELTFTDGTFAAVVCFTMLHHVSSTEEQDALFGEACRVLGPGGLFAGTDSLASPSLRDFHRDDTYVPVDPAGLPDRLAAAGFVNISVARHRRANRFAFNAHAPR